MSRGGPLSTRFGQLPPIDSSVMVARKRVGSFEVSRSEVVGSAVDGEVVAVNLDSGSHYNVAGAGTDIWVAVEQAASAEEVANRLAHRYDGLDDIAAAVTRFMDELEELLLVDPVHDVREQGWPQAEAD
jgi:phosphosulfolactate phosphohydrolase-like enzyme